MNYDFLQSYSIPILKQRSKNQYPDVWVQPSSEVTKEAGDVYYDYGGTNTFANINQSASGCPGQMLLNPERFIPPSKHGVGYRMHKTGFKRKSEVIGGAASKKEAIISEVSCDGKLVMFLGRDESYPNELNALIHPLSCDLCNIKMNSRMLAKDHYESKAHDKHISAWLYKNYTEKGVEPPSVKRFIKQGAIGPDAYYCETCDLKLTSLIHASQHYAGKKHRMVIARKAKPSGAGFYNSDGKWVRTELTPNASTDNRFRIGDAFKITESLTSTSKIYDNKNASAKLGTTVTDNTVKKESKVEPICGNPVKTRKLNNNVDQNSALFCTICNINVTSAVQMTTHIAGSKHLKKLKQTGLNLTPIQSNTEPSKNATPPVTMVDNVVLPSAIEDLKHNPTDLSMYRTPSGQYYCMTCNTSMSHLPGLEQHLKGKRHMKKLTEEKAKASLAAKKKH